MYNYYIEQKKQEIAEKKHKEEKELFNFKKRRQSNIYIYIICILFIIEQQKHLLLNYEKRMKKFLYEMAEKPIQIHKFKPRVISIDTKCSFYRTDSPYNQTQTHKAFSSEHNKNTFTTSPNQSMRYSKIQLQTTNHINNNSKLHNNKNEKKFIQPIMRFKPRTDMERVVDALVQFSPYDHLDSKLIVKEQLDQMGIITPEGETKVMKPKKKKVDNYKVSHEIHSSDNSIIYNYDITKNEQQQHNNNVHNDNGIHNKNNNNNENVLKHKKYTLKKKTKKIDNSNAKKIHPDLYNKTYFKAVENYSLFKNSIFVPNTKSIFKIYTNQALKQQQQLQGCNHNNHSRTNITSYNHKSFMLKHKHSYSTTQGNTMDINLLKCNLSPSSGSNSSLIKSLDKVDSFSNSFKLYRNYSNMNKEDKLEQVHKLAFPHLYNKDDYINESDLLTSEDRDYKKGQIPQYVYIEGVRYNKKNLEEISNKVLEICNLRPKKKNK